VSIGHIGEMPQKVQEVHMEGNSSVMSVFKEKQIKGKGVGNVLSWLIMHLL